MPSLNATQVITSLVGWTSGQGRLTNSPRLNAILLPIIFELNTQ